MVVDKRQMSHILSKYLNNYTIKAQIRKYLLECRIAIESRAAAAGVFVCVWLTVQLGGSSAGEGGMDRSCSKDR